MICIFSPARTLTGGTYRSLKSLSGFPSGKYRLYMPIDVKESIINQIAIYLGAQNSLINVVKEAIETEPLDPCTGRRSCYIKYGIKLEKRLLEEKCDFLYIPHEHPYIPAGFSRLKWTMLLQITPVIGSLFFEEGGGFLLYWKNMRKAHQYSVIKTLRGYLRLLAYKKLIERNKILAVSRSIPYELQLLGIRGDIAVLDPGIGVDPCPVGRASQKLYDVVFYARITPEKGIYDFLEIVKRLQKVKPGLRALAMGFATRGEMLRIREYVNRLGISVDLLFNLKREEALTYLAKSKVMIYPTRADAFPLAVLESLSCGTPVVAYSIPAIRLNFNTEAVVKVTPGDIDLMVAVALSTLEKSEEFSKIGLEFSTNFTWERVSAEEWAKVEAIQKAI